MLHFRTVDDLKVCTTKNMSYSIVERGSPNTLEYRVYFGNEDDKTRGSVSLKHDGPTGQTTGLADFYRAMLCLCLSVCLSVSVTSRCSTKTAKRRITQTTPYDSPGTLSYLMPKISAKFDRGHHLLGRRMQVGSVKIGDFRQILAG